MKSFLFPTIIIILISSLFYTCKKKAKDPQPSCVSESFSFVDPLNVTSQNIDFTLVTSDTITARFSNLVDWTLTIKGVSSGAQRIYSGKSDSISIIWDGRPGQNKFYSIEEDVTVTLSIPCNQNYTKTVHVKNYPNGSDIKGIMASDFDGEGYLPNSTTIGYNSSGWSSGGAGTVTKFQIGSTPFSAPQGSKYLTFQGTGVIGHVCETYVNAPTTMPGSNADSTYFNAYLSSVSPATTQLSIALSVAGKSYFYTLPLDWQGWKLVSIKLSDFKYGNVQPITDPTKLVVINFELYTLSQNIQTVEMDIDNFYFSYGKPLN